VVAQQHAAGLAHRPDALVLQELLMQARHVAEVLAGMTSDPAIGDRLRADLAQSKCTITPRVESVSG